MNAMEEICHIHVDIPNAPDLVLDLLAAHGAALSGQAICGAGRLLGHRESTMRVAMTRLLAGQKIQRASRGLYTLHRPGLTLANALNAWNQEMSDEIAWQGDWVAVHDAAVARSDKTSWRRHQLALSLRGFASFQHGLQLRPCNRAGGIDAERCKLQALGLSPDARVFLLSHLDDRDNRHAFTLWPVKELITQYKALRQALATHLPLLHAMPREQALRESLLLGRTAVSQLVRDPMLPPELMPPKTRDALIAKVHDYKRIGHGLWTQWT
jgi:phenylacetic acid degradation operon negative regulatory protein